MPAGQDVLQLAIVTTKWSHGMNMLTTIRQQWFFGSLLEKEDVTTLKLADALLC